MFLSFSPVFGNEEISASDWLNSKADAKPTFTILPETPKNNSKIERVEEIPLGKINLNSVGLISADDTNFPKNLWNRSDEALLAKKIQEMPKLKLTWGLKCESLLSLLLH